MMPGTAPTVPVIPCEGQTKGKHNQGQGWRTDAGATRSGLYLAVSRAAASTGSSLCVPLSVGQAS